jgi:D-serine deaminase-like pyridoxal phosphate-dependent protein
LTELECGTYVFMDTEYFIIGGKDGDMKRYNDWQPALTVLTTVDSEHHPNIITTDYGAKALAKKTDEVKGMPWLEVGTGGAEYGSLRWKDGDRAPKLGERIEIYCTNLDQSTNQRFRPLLCDTGRTGRRRLAHHGPRRRGATPRRICHFRTTNN